MTPEGLLAAKSKAKLQLVDAVKNFHRKCGLTYQQAVQEGWNRSSTLILEIHRNGEGELLDRARAVWVTFREMTDNEGYFSSEDNRGQLREMLDEVLGPGSADIEEEYERHKRGMPNPSWPNFDAARQHAGDSVMADAEIDFRRRTARRPPLADELSPPRYGPTREHWRKALEASEEQPPNLPEAVKEAAHALESLAQIVLGKPGQTLGDAVKELRSRQRLPVGADKVLEGVYAFASSAPGARHGSALPAHVDLNHWWFVRTTTEGAIRLLLDIDAQ